MYRPGGHAYVYLIYGIHFCFNVVTQNIKKPEAVLIRALFPVDGKELMMRRRQTKIEKQLCSGPGKLCQAMGIDRSITGFCLQAPNSGLQSIFNLKK